MCRGMRLLTLTSVLVLAVGQDHPYHGNPDGILFPGPIGRKSQGIPDLRSRTQERSADSSDLSVALKMAKEVNELQTVEDFLTQVKGVPPSAKDLFTIDSRISGVERSNAEVAKPAKCMPELQTVPIKENHADPSTIYFPSCTRVMRCGGCCSHSLLSCQPVSSEIRNFQVIVTKVEHGQSLSYRGKEIVPTEEHTKCKCDCKFKPEHCTEKQIYVEDECRCTCSNVDEEEKCRRSNETKLWDPDLCSCLCRTSQECTTGFYFDLKTCSCSEVPFSQNWFASDRIANRFQPNSKPDTPPLIVTLDAADPRRKHKDDPEY
ncbi:vascular endothelial growth factor C [Orussus abietinus]|uniref:vascular endothelial growth factor C n=1 Tax=Orussus abietinus TaxID=222816 RepID=UPI000625FE5A|nr:vascular endothelial growth factor C [Orussus abietinus]